MTKQELFTRLKRHDWYYAMSDDHSVWLRGVKDQKEIDDELVRQECPYVMWEIHNAIKDNNQEVLGWFDE